MYAVAAGRVEEAREAVAKLEGKRFREALDGLDKALERLTRARDLTDELGWLAAFERLGAGAGTFHHRGSVTRAESDLRLALERLRQEPAELAEKIERARENAAAASGPDRIRDPATVQRPPSSGGFRTP